MKLIQMNSKNIEEALKNSSKKQMLDIEQKIGLINNEKISLGLNYTE
jgi:hypothetical protein